VLEASSLCFLKVFGETHSQSLLQNKGVPLLGLFFDVLLPVCDGLEDIFVQAFKKVLVLLVLVV
jgi:hypothetical protein